MTKRFNLWPIIIVILTFMVVFGDLQAPFRSLVALCFMMVCPGMAFVPLLRIGHRLIEWLLAIMLSLALDSVVAMLMLYVVGWSYRVGLIMLSLISIAGAVTQAFVSYRASAGILQPDMYDGVKSGGPRGRL